MKILLDNFIFDLQYAGGISKVWYNLLNGINKCKDCETLMIESENVNNLFRNDLDKEEFTVVSERSWNVNLRKFKRVKPQNSDIYHSSYFRPLKRKNSTKVVVTVHDFIYEKYARRLPKLIHIYFKNRALKQADAVICVSRNTRDDFYKYYPNFSKNAVHVVYNGVDDCFKPIGKNKLTTVNDFGLEENSFLMYVGNRGYAKNFAFIWRLLKSEAFLESGLKLVCVGGGSLTKSEQVLIEELGVSTRIILLKDITPTQLNELYNLAFLLLFPSIYEGFGIPVLEAMKAGCPVWSSNSSSVRELLGPEYPISFNPLKWEDALFAFVELFSEELRENARQVGLIQSINFSWENCVEDTLEVYRKCLNDE